MFVHAVRTLPLDVYTHAFLSLIQRLASTGISPEKH